jgi:hypothetical protein
MLKTWKAPVKLHCCPQRAISVLAAILLLQLIEEQRESDESAERLPMIGQRAALSS